MRMLEHTLRYLVIGGIFALPFVCLVVAQSLFFPYITGKNFTFRIIVEVITGAWLALALVNPKYRPARSWVLAAFSLFVLVLAVADAQGAYPFKSFWSNYERMDGWVTLVHLLAYLVVAASVMHTEKLWTRLWQVNSAISVLVGLNGLMQVAGLTAIGQGGNGGLSARIDATFGNPIYLAVYMLFAIFLTAHLWMRMWEERGPGKRLPLSILYGSVIVLDTVTLFLTGTRGTMLGLVGGALLAAVLFAWQQGSRLTRLVAVSSITLTIVLGGALHLARDSSFVQRVGFLDRLATISLTDRTIAARFLNMGVAWQGVKERPIFGWGQENYAIVFDKYYDPRMYADEPWFDRVHNVVFDWLIAGGIVGLLSYVSIFLALLYILWFGKAFSNTEKALFTGLLAGYTFHNLTVFDNITSYIFFVSVVAYLMWRDSGARHAAPIVERRILSERSLPVAAAIGVVFVFGTAWFVNAGALAQNRLILQALSPQQEGVSKNVEIFKQAIAYGSFGTQEAREQLAQAATQIAQSQTFTNEQKQAFFDLATAEMMKQAAASPLDARFPLFLGTIYEVYGDYADASKAFQKAHELSPRKQTILFQIGIGQQNHGDLPGALKTLKEAYELEPSFVQARVIYASVLIRAGQLAAADELLAPIIPTGEAADPRIAAAYLAIKRFDKIASIWEAYVKASPNDVQGYFTLAAAYYGGGNSAKAIDALKRVAAVNPSVAAQAEALILQIRSGTAILGTQ